MASERENPLHPLFINRCFDKGRLKSLILWSLRSKGEEATLKMVERLKQVGFHFATKAGISIGLDDLRIPPTKASLIVEVEQEVALSQQECERGNLTSVESFQHLVDIWHSSSERLRKEVVRHFHSTDLMNPVYMMAFSGARGSISQVRQLAGMRGLMADPQGQLIGFPIRSNFREGLTLTEYMISCYGARKGLVDTALRTADAGYLTRRLVDVSHHVVVTRVICGAQRGISLSKMESGGKTVLSLRDRLLGRVLAEAIPPLSQRNQEISDRLARKISLLRQEVSVRSPLTCAATRGICQFCYGWSLSQGQLVLLGEAVGVVAAQSIGEPGTQLTMRTFHTGGVFSGDIIQEIRAPHDGKVSFREPLQGVLVRTSHGKVAFLAKQGGNLTLSRKGRGSTRKGRESTPFQGVDPLIAGDRNTPLKGVTERSHPTPFTEILLPSSALLFVRHQEEVSQGQLLAELSSLEQERNEELQGKMTLFSSFSGEVSFGNISLIHTPEVDRSHLALSLGAIWVVSATTAQPLFSLPVYNEGTHLINNLSLASRSREGELFFGGVRREGEGQPPMLRLPAYILQRLPVGGASPLQGDQQEGSDPPLLEKREAPPPCRGMEGVSHHTRQALLADSLCSKKKGVQLFALTTRSLVYRYGWGHCLSLSTYPFRGLRQVDSLLMVEGLKYDEGWKSQRVQAPVQGVSGQVISFTHSPPFKAYRSGGSPSGSGRGIDQIDLLSLFDPNPNKEEQRKKGVSFTKTIAFWCPKRYKARDGGVLRVDKRYSPLQGYGGNLIWLSSARWGFSKYVACWGCYPPSPLSSTETRPFKRGSKIASKTLWPLSPLAGRLKSKTCFNLDLSLSPSSFTGLTGFQDPIQGATHWKGVAAKATESPSLLCLLSIKEMAHFQRKAISTVTRRREISPFSAWNPFHLARHLDKGCSPLHLAKSRWQGWIGRGVVMARRKNLQGETASLFSRESGWSLLSAQPSYTISPLIPKKRDSWKRLGPLPSTKRSLSSCKVRGRGTSLFCCSHLMVTNPLMGVQVGGVSLFTERGTSLLKKETANQTTNQTGNVRSLTLPNLPFPLLTEKTGFLLPSPKGWETDPLLDTLPSDSEVGRVSSKKDLSHQEVNRGVQTSHSLYHTRPLLGHLSVELTRGWVYLPKQGKEILPLWGGETGLPLFPPGTYLRDKLLLDQWGVYASGLPAVPSFYPLKRMKGGRRKSNANGQDKRVARGKWKGVRTLIRFHLREELSREQLTREELTTPSKGGLHNQVSCYQPHGWRWSERGSGGNWGGVPLSTTELLLFLRKIFWREDNLSLKGQERWEWFSANSGERGFYPFVQAVTTTHSRFTKIVTPPTLSIEGGDHLGGSGLREERNCSLLSLLQPSPSSLSSLPFFLFKQERVPPSGELCLTLREVYPETPRLPDSQTPRLRTTNSQRKSGSLEVRSTNVVCQEYKRSLPGVGSSMSQQRLPNTQPFHPLSGGNSLEVAAPRGAKRGEKEPHRSVLARGVEGEERWSTELSRLQSASNTFSERSFFVMIEKPFLCSLPQPRQSKQWLAQQISLGKQRLTREKRVLVQTERKGNAPLLGNLGIDYLVSHLFHPPAHDSGPFNPISYHSTYLLRGVVSLFIPGSTYLSIGCNLRVLREASIPFKGSKQRLPKGATCCSDLTTPPHLNTFSTGFDLLLSHFSNKSGREGVSDSLFPLAGHGRDMEVGQAKIVRSLTHVGEAVCPVLRSNPGKSVADTLLSPDCQSFLSQKEEVNQERGLLLTRNNQISFACSDPSLEERGIAWQDVSVGQLIRQGDRVNSQGGFSISGKVISIERSRITLRRAQLLSLYSNGVNHVSHQQWVEKGSPLITLTYQKLITGDIVQGIPKIEQLFEAPSKSKGKEIAGSPQLVTQNLFKAHKRCHTLVQAVRKSLNHAQALLVEGVQRVYLSQGVLISDKHVEIAVRGMTSKARVVEAGDTGFLPGESFPLRVIEAVNLAIYGRRADYEPVITGITNASLTSESFISAASFQETTRVLSRSTLAGRTDFMRGLKERVVLGDVIQAGTGVISNQVYHLLVPEKVANRSHPSKQHAISIEKTSLTKTTFRG